jgi:uncharacterized protein YjbI with pentapeptide repeats
MARATTDPRPRPAEPPRIDPDLTPRSLDDGIAHDDRLHGVALSGSLPAGTFARGVQIEDARAELIDLAGARMPGISLADVELRGANLANADLRSASLRRVAIVRGRLTGVQWSGGRLDDVRFDGCQIDLAAFTGCELRRVEFHDCRLVGSDLQELQAQDVAFADCDLSEVDLTLARFTRTEMQRCTLDGIRALERLRGVGMRWEDVLSSAGAFAGAIGIRLIDA